MKIPRSIAHRYDDPLSLVWLRTARQLGIEVARSREVFASWDGAGTLTLGADEDLDDDDCLAQMILHELCHALVEGEVSHEQTDWGLDNTDDRDATREFATLRLQAALLAPHGLRRMLAVTTDWRAAYDALPLDPLAGDDEATRLARAGWRRATDGPWAGPLRAALTATAALAETTRAFTTEGSLWALVDLPEPPR
jgi:hypothetical protein